MTHEELEDAIPLYAAGTLDRAERQALEAHLLSGCASCHSMLQDYQSLAAHLPLGLSQISPPESLKSTIMATPDPSPPPPPPDDTHSQPARSSREPGGWMDHLLHPASQNKSLSLPWAIGLTTLGLLTTGGYLAWTMAEQHAEVASKIQQLQTSLQEQSTTLATVQRETDGQTKALAELRHDLQQQTSAATEIKEQLARHEAELQEARLQLSLRDDAGTSHRPQDELALLLRRPDIRPLPLTGSDLAKRASGLLLYDPVSHKIWLYAVNLPESPAGTTYQLWAVRGKPISIGTFQIGRGKTTHLLVKKVTNFAGVKTFVVSLEPSGGRPQPTGPMYLLNRF